jgi:hypothetical protein
MAYCSACGHPLNENSRFCPGCGTSLNTSSSAVTYLKRPATAPPPLGDTHPRHAAAARGFGQLFGLDPRIAFLTLILDTMLNAGELLTLGLLVPFSILAGLALGFATYKAQRNWYGDDRDSAMVKAVIIGTLTAIPTPLPAILYLPAGVLGLIHNFRAKQIANHPKSA